MRRIIITQTLTTFLTFATLDIALADDIDFGLGINTGIGLVDQYGEGADRQNSDSLRYKPGYLGGLSLRLGWHKRFGFQLEVLYRHKGAAIEDPQGNDTGITVDMDYVSGTLLADLNIVSRARWRLYLSSGMELGYLVGVGDLSIDGFRRLDISVVGGIGGAWRPSSSKHELFATIRYDAGLRSVDAMESIPAIRNHAGMLTLGYRYYILSRGDRAVDPNKDSDDDGIRDKEDKCVDEAEDRDGFEDEDGCPDTDNDSDGIDDTDDKCPEHAEPEGEKPRDGCPDKDGDGVWDHKEKEPACVEQAEDPDGWLDDDGCPDLDNDGDNIPDDKDSCPDKPEDADGFEDENGCPDPDNDGDSILDDVDGTNGACKDEPETRNGWQDDDGCKDRVPKAVARLVGVFRAYNKTRNQKRLASTLEKNAGFKLLILGYDTKQTAAEDKVETLKNALLAQGIAEDRLQTRGCVVPKQGIRAVKKPRIELAIVGDASRPKDYCEAAPSRQKPRK